MRRHALLIPLLAIVGCGGSPKPGDSGKLNVVVTFSVLTDFTKQVGGDKVEITTLVGPDGDAHVFNPTPQDVAAIGRAGVIFENGAKFESDWFNKAYEASRSKANRVSTSEGMKLMEGDPDHKNTDLEPGHIHEVDPHVWHEVNNAIHMVGRVRDGLCEADPANSDYYRANAEKYLAKLKDLDAWILKTVAELPPTSRKLVTSHDTFGYFAKRYGFTVEGSVLPSFSTETADPSAKDFAELVDKVKREKVKAIFCEASHNDKLVNRLAQAAGVTVATPLYTDALGSAGSPGETYEGMMRHNVTTIVAALRP